MPKGRQLPRRQRRGIGCLVVLLLLFGVPALKVALTTPRPPRNVVLPPLPPGKDQYTLYIVAQAFHTVLVVEQPAGWRLGPPGAETARYLQYSWGDRLFYGINDHSVGAVLTATFWGTPSVVYLEGMDQFPEPNRSLRGIYYRNLTAAETRTLFLTLEEAMARTPDGQRPVPLPRRATKRGVFYPAWETYIFWNDCNRWIVESLRPIDGANTGVGVILTQQVPGRLKGFHRETPSH